MGEPGTLLTSETNSQPGPRQAKHPSYLMRQKQEPKSPSLKPLLASRASSTPQESQASVVLLSSERPKRLSDSIRFVIGSLLLTVAVLAGALLFISLRYINLLREPPNGASCWTEWVGAHRSPKVPADFQVSATCGLQEMHRFRLSMGTKTGFPKQRKYETLPCCKRGWTRAGGCCYKSLERSGTRKEALQLCLANRFNVTRSSDLSGLPILPSEYEEIAFAEHLESLALSSAWLGYGLDTQGRLWTQRWYHNLGLSDQKDWLSRHQNLDSFSRRLVLGRLKGVRLKEDKHSCLAFNLTSPSGVSWSLQPCTDRLPIICQSYCSPLKA